MASQGRRFLQSPLRIMLVLQVLTALATGGVLVASLVYAKRPSGATGLFATLGGAVRADAAGAGGLTLLWAVLIPLAALLIASLVFGLVYGRWGLPGYLQGRAVYFAPPLAAVCFAAGVLVLGWIDGESFAAGWRRTVDLVSTSAGLTLMLIYVCLSTAAIGLGWSIALAVTHYQRRRGKWETIGYVQQQP